MAYFDKYSIQQQQNAYILFKCTWNIYQNRPYSGLYESQYIGKDSSHNKICPLITMQVEVNNRKTLGKSPGIWKLDNTLLNHHGSNKKYKGTPECILNGMKETQHIKICWLLLI